MLQPFSPVPAKFRSLTAAVLSLGLGVLAAPSLATPLGAGPLASLGAQTDGYSIYAGVVNPALGSLMIPAREQWRLSYAPAISSRTEVGQVDNFVDDLNDLIDLIDDPSTNTQPVQTVLDRFNRALAQMGQDGYLKNTTNLHAPITPVYFRPAQLDGTLMADVRVVTQAFAGILDAPLAYDDQSKAFSTAAAAYLKGAIETSVALGYSQPVFAERLKQDYGAQVLAGASVRIYSLELSKQIFLLQKLDGKDIGDVISDEFDSNTQSTTAAGLDLGLAWLAEHYRLGATLYNVNQPSFDYGTIGENCAARTGISRSNCEAAAEFALVKGEIRTRESHKKTAYITLDGRYAITPQWSVSGALDLAAHDDWVGTENQWLHLATAYQPAGDWWPDWRLALQKNLVGSELTQMALGLSLGGVFSVDLAWALDQVDIDGTQAPRSLAISLSLAESF